MNTIIPIGRTDHTGTCYPAVRKTRRAPNTGSRQPWLSGILLAFVLSWPAFGQDIPTEPEITGFEPAASQILTTVKIFGSGLGPYRPGRYRIFFNGVEGSLFEPQFEESGEFTAINLVGFGAVVPPGASSGPVTIVLPGLEDPGEEIVIVSQFDFEVLPPGEPPPVPGPLAIEATMDSSDGYVHFRRLTENNFVSEVTDSKDVVIADLDSDGDNDAFIPQTSCAGCPDDDVVYRNDGNDIEGNPNIAVVHDSVTNDVSPKRQYGIDGADFDNDGDIDVVPSGASGPTPDRLRILVNNGSGVFTDEAMIRVSDLMFVIGEDFRWDDAEFGDVDGDGDLDIVLANRRGSGRSALLVNDGPGAGLGLFTAFADIFGEPLGEYHHDGRFCDLNNDGLPEVILSHDWQGGSKPLRLAFNQGGSPPVFVDASNRLFPNPAAQSEHVGCQDFNNDGLMDIHVGVFERDDVPDGMPGHNEDMIYLNTSVDTDGMNGIELSELQLDLHVNAEPASVQGEGFDAMAYSAAYGDLNNDGDIDIVVGSMTPPGGKGPFVMLNDGTGTFTNVSEVNNYWRDLSNTGFDHFNPTSPDIADLNGDGLLDIIFAMGDTMNGPADEANRIFIQDQPPVAEICEDVIAECAGPTTMVMLDGSCSMDPEGSVLSFQWDSATCSFSDATAIMPLADCPLGDNTVSLTVTDTLGLVSEPDSATVSIIDTTPPEISVVLEPDTLWPPNHKLPTVTATITVEDVCDADPAVTLASIVSDEPDNGLGDGDTANDIQGAEVGTDDREFELRAERDGRGDGRTYTVTYQAIDGNGNESEDSATVEVMSNQGNK